MKYHETGFLRALKYLRPPVVPKFGTQSIARNTDEPELLDVATSLFKSIIYFVEFRKNERFLSYRMFSQEIKSKILSILGKFEQLRDDYSSLKEEFMEISFEENDGRIKLAADLLFREAYEKSAFRFKHYLDFVAGLRSQSVKTYRKFIERLIELCDSEVSALIWHEYADDRYVM